MARLRPRARAREKGGRSKQSARGNRSVARTAVYRWRLAFNLSQSVCHARAMSSALRISRMLNLPVCSYYAPGFHALAIKARAVQQEIVAAGATCTGSSAPAPVVSSAAAAPLTDLPASAATTASTAIVTLCSWPSPSCWSATAADPNRRPRCIVLLDPPTTTDSEMPL